MQQALSIELDETEKKAVVTVSKDEQSLAIGKGGQNVRLAAKLTGWKIDIVSSGGEMIAEADEAGMLTIESDVSDATITEEVSEVLESLNVAESDAPKNAEVENVVEDEAPTSAVTDVTEEGERIVSSTEGSVEEAK
jgi:N utilization substance protein A